MIASRAALVVLAAVTAALAIVLAVDISRAPPTRDRALVPGLDVDRVARLAWTRGGETVELVRGGRGWAIGGAHADAHAVDAVLAALRGARWHRRGAPGRVHATLTIDGATTIGIGEPLAGAEQAWLVVDHDDALLVDGWVARALDPEPLALHVRHPLDDIAAAKHVVAGELLLDLPATRARPSRVLLDSARAQELVRALAALELAALPSTVPPAGDYAIGYYGGANDPRVHATLGGDCPGAPSLVALFADGDVGCAERGAADAVKRIAGELGGDAASLAERRPLPIAPKGLTLIDGVVLDLAKRPMIAGAAADSDRVRELLDALATPGEIVARPTRGLISRAGELELYPDDIVARPLEPIAIRIPHAAYAAIARPSSAYRDRTLWLEEPSTIASIAIDGATYARGAVVGEWTGARDPALVDAAAQALAAPRATGDAPPASFAIAHRIDVSITEPTGASRAHHLELGALASTGCAARADNTLVTLPVAACTAIVAAAAETNKEQGTRK